jgi:magnesium-transporting ATPase (P-type)
LVKGGVRHRPRNRVHEQRSETEEVLLRDPEAGSAAGSPSDETAVLWHVISVEDAARRLATAPGAGLTAEKATRRLGVHGTNEIREQARRSAWQMFFSQFTDFMILLLLAAAVISGFVGEPEDAMRSWRS